MTRTVPGFPAYSFSKSGVLRRVLRGQGARVGVKRPHRHSRQITFKLFRDGKPTYISKAALNELVFGGDETLKRYSRGEACYKAKLTDRDVLNIRHLAGHLSSRKIVGALGLKVNSATVRQVLRGRTWRHI